MRAHQVSCCLADKRGGLLNGQNTQKKKRSKPIGKRKKKQKTKKAATATVGDFSMEPNRAIAVFAV